MYFALFNPQANANDGTQKGKTFKDQQLFLSNDAQKCGITKQYLNGFTIII